uniref:MITD1 C-terminal phospholipase D-like domain-containing protein n=1 Tax=Parascaris univalens TaxID=6257 RepID=A0A915BZS0_PARUN
MSIIGKRCRNYNFLLSISRFLPLSTVRQLFYQVFDRDFIKSFCIIVFIIIFGDYLLFIDYRFLEDRRGLLRG